MLIDARTLPDQTAVQADIAIIGGGPAGITLCRALARQGLDICLVEAGGTGLDPEVQAMYAGETTGIHYPLSETRLRYLGGSSGHWGGYCRPLDPIDFEARDWVPYSGWPFGISELLPYYPTACELVEVSPGRFDDRDYWQSASGQAIPPLVTGRLRQQFVHFSPPTRFGERYRPDLENSDRIRVLLNASVVNIASLESGRSVSRLDVRTLTGLSHTVTARYYILATGGLENARLLLVSKLGNQHDLVGRFFMEHPHLSGFGEIVVADLDRLPHIYRERIRSGDRSASAAFNPTAEFLREQRLLNATFMVGVVGGYAVTDQHDSGGQHAGEHRDMLAAAQHFLRDKTANQRPEAKDSLGVWLGIGCACEQLPNPASRVSLALEKDPLGLNRISLDWRLSAQDRHSVVAHMHSLALEFGAQGIGRMNIRVEDDGTWPAQVNGGSHHMGTTRMHDDPRQGVVDRNGRVHGVDNLYVAGSSVFPTSGASNPTLTLLALSLRLAEHLGTRLQ